MSVKTFEIHATVLRLAENKASGPDGVPNEFAQLYWSEVKDKIVNLIQGFHSCCIDISNLNRANIVMVPKKDSPMEVKDFRPISIINIVPKIISKLLATRLAGFLPNLVSIRQIAFVQGRQISEIL